MIDYPKRGEIYLINLPLKPGDNKNRPALVISLDVRNKFAGDIIVIPISTNLRKSPVHIIYLFYSLGIDCLSFSISSLKG